MERRHGKALVTLAIGDFYLDTLERYCLPTWRPYAEKHGYDLIVLTEPIDPPKEGSRKSLHWQKLLITLLPDIKVYDRVVWLDSDILINAAAAPCIVSQTEEGRIGAVEVTRPHLVPDHPFTLHGRFQALNYHLIRQLAPSAPPAVIGDGDIGTYYRMAGLDPVARLINTGVLVFSPADHGDFLAQTYLKYQGDAADYEQTFLSHALQAEDRVAYLDPRFNANWASIAAEHYPFLFDVPTLESSPALLKSCVNTAFRNNWFLHFAGGRKNPLVKRAFALVDPEPASLVEMVHPGEAAPVTYLRGPEWERVNDTLGEIGKDYMLFP